MRWSTIKSLVESKAFWSLNILLFIVPFLARFGVKIAWDVFGLYVSAWLLLVAGGIYYVTRPLLIRYATPGELKNAGLGRHTLANELVETGQKISDVEEPHRTTLENTSDLSNFGDSTFHFVFKHVDNSKTKLRIVLSAFIALAGLILLSVNLYRFCVVVDNLPPIMNHQNPKFGKHIPHGTFFSAGDSVDVEHEDGKGGATTTSGTVQSPDEDGYIVVKTPDGKTRYIPKGRVIKVDKT